jgi:exonuclease SbcC
MEARQVLDDIDQRLRELGYDARAHDQMRQRVRAGREIQQTWESLGKARATLETVQRMMIEQQSQLTAAGMELATAKLAYDTAQDQYEALLQGANGFTEANRQWLEMRNAVSQTSRELGGAEQQVNSLQGYRDQQTMYANEKQTLSSKIDLYRQLEDAFSKNGIQALMIEQAIPEIEEQANDLLSRLSSTGMMVQFRTQEAYKDKRRTDMRETLDIVISDNAGVRSYEMYSGGEAFRVNFAIRLALSRMLAGRSGARLQTLVIDEGFGSQDAEGVQRLVEAINAIQGDFSKILVITHMETLKESFPAQIEVVKTPSGSQFQVLV